ncbi:MAG: glucose 1-dehydrogenase [Burkholderiales bacterium]|nr:glucose 1-dehydrogenase [Burkholderiales bacterium]
MSEPLPDRDRLLGGDVAVVTGAARGNGLAMARGLAAAGAAVALLDVDGAAVSQAARSIAEAGGRVVGLQLDVTQADACREVAARVESELGPASILVNNAGILHKSPLDSEQFAEHWQAVFRTNVDGCINMVQALRDQLCRTRGRIVNIGSIGSFRGVPTAIAYVSSKGAVLQMTKGLAAELAPHGIRVNGIAPGRFATAMTESYRDEPAIKAAYMSRTPLGRYGEPEDLVGPVVFLASAMSAYITGVMLPVDGGFLAV